MRHALSAIPPPSLDALLPELRSIDLDWVGLIASFAGIPASEAWRFRGHVFIDMRQLSAEEVAKPSSYGALAAAWPILTAITPPAELPHLAAAAAIPSSIAHPAQRLASKAAETRRAFAFVASTAGLPRYGPPPANSARNLWAEALASSHPLTSPLPPRNLVGPSLRPRAPSPSPGLACIIPSSPGPLCGLWRYALRPCTSPRGRESER